MDSLIIYFEVLLSLTIVFFFFKYSAKKLAEMETRKNIANAIASNYTDVVKAILIIHANRLSSEVKVDVQNWLDERSK